MQSINLIPQEEAAEQVEQKAVTLSTWVSIVVVVIIGAIAGFYIYRTQTLKSQIKNVSAQIDDSRQKIGALAPVEINARNLDKKYSTLKDIFSKRVLYSMLVTEIQSRIPTGMFLDSLTLQKGTQLNITGHADNYLLIATFTNNLVSTDFANGNPDLKKLFTAVTLNSVSLQKTQNLVVFSINVTVDQSLLKKK